MGFFMDTPDTPNTVDAPAQAGDRPDRPDSTSVEPSVAAVVIARRAGDLGEVLSTVAAQLYSASGIYVVGDETVGLSDVPVQRVAGMRDLAAAIQPGIEYLWVVDQDARPRPDALKALVAGAQQVDASVAGSKLLRSDRPDELVSVGAATDVFGVPYTGLDVGEVDQEQYDVVRDIAFVEPASVLIRRDLFVGLGGLDTHMPFESSGIDFCQRARINGARVVVVPSSEALLVGARSDRTRTWREQAGRIRGMLKSYSMLTLLWALPGLVIVGLVTAIHDTLRGRPLALIDWVRSWAWNMLHIGSTLQGRLRARSSRQAGDDELFRYQVAGSVHLKEMAAGLSDRLANPDEDADIFETDVLSLPGFWQQPSFIAATLSVLFVFLSSRSLWLDGMPAVGFSLPLRDAALTTLGNYLGGWNPAELGSPAPQRPIVGVLAAMQFLLFSRPGLAATVVTVGAAILGVVGMARVLRALGLSAYARYGAGVVLMAGPVTGYVAGSGAWDGLISTGVLPWVVVGALAPAGSGFMRVRWAARIVFAAAIASAFSPLVALVSPVVLLLAALMIGRSARLLVGAAASAVGAVILLPWVGAQTLQDLVSGGGDPLYFDPAWWVAAWVGAAILGVVIAVARGRGGLAAWGAIVASGGLLIGRVARLDIGRDLSLAGLAMAAFGLAVITGLALGMDVAEEGIGAGTRLVRRFAVVLGAGLVVFSFSPLLAGRAGLPNDAFADGLAFTTTRAAAHGVDRSLLIGPADTLPGEPRRLADGTAYRLVGGSVPYLDEAWPADPRLGDEALAELLEALAAGDELRPGEMLSPFAIRWVVFTGPSMLEPALTTQLDLQPLPDLGYGVYENDELSPRAITESGRPWTYEYPVYVAPGGAAANEVAVRIAENADVRWGDDWEQVDWANLVRSDTGSVEFGGVDALRTQAIVVMVVVAVIGLVAVVPQTRGRSQT
jgi:GT2 family glycosyltransferase